MSSRLAGADPRRAVSSWTARSGLAAVLACVAAIGALALPARAGAPAFRSAAPKLGAPLPRGAAGVWQWVPVDGAVCRDGSPTGFFVKFGGASKNVMIYLEGGGACFNAQTCGFTPRNINELVVGETMETARAYARPQVPWTEGIFDASRAENPVRDWNMVYVPYCTGDTHAGTRANVTVPGLAQPQQFVGYRNMTAFLARIIPTFASAEKVLLTGTSAGGVGAAANFNQTQDGFGQIPVVLLDDSGPIFSDEYFSVCLQRRMRELWGLNGSLPPDCPDCFPPDGGSLGAAAAFLEKKYPNAVAGVVSSLEDSIMRFFFSWGENDCHVATYARDRYSRALVDMRDHHGFDPAHFGTFFLPGKRHTHIFRERFYTETVGGVTLAQWTSELLEGRPSRVSAGP